jgi:hypothetical protein
MFTARVDTEANVQDVVAAAGTVKNFYFVIDTTPAAARSWTLTVRKNGANTAVTCTISNPNTSCSDLTHSVAFVAGDFISVAITASAPAPGGTPGRWTAQFAP